MIATLISGRITSAPELRKTAEGRHQTVASIQARLGREGTEVWQAIAYNPSPRNALLRLKVGELVSVQGTPTIRMARVSGETIIRRILHVECVLPLRSGEGEDGSL
jgi:hypothetical protein